MAMTEEDEMGERMNLISLCHKGVVHHSDWDNRDTASAQLQLGQALALLRSGCKYKILTAEDDKGGMVTDAETIWVQFWVKDFNWFENAEETEFGNQDNGQWEVYRYYIPTAERLVKSKKQDWYDVELNTEKDG